MIGALPRGRIVQPRIWLSLRAEHFSIQGSSGAESRQRRLTRAACGGSVPADAELQPAPPAKRVTPDNESDCGAVGASSADSLATVAVALSSTTGHSMSEGAGLDHDQHASKSESAGSAPANLLAALVTTLQSAGLAIEQAESLALCASELAASSLGAAESAAARIVEAATAHTDCAHALHEAGVVQLMAQAAARPDRSTALATSFAAYLDCVVALEDRDVVLYSDVFADVLHVLRCHLEQRDAVHALCATLYGLAKKLEANDLLMQMLAGLLPVLRTYCTDQAVCSAALGTLASLCSEPHVPARPICAYVDELATLLTSAVRFGGASVSPQLLLQSSYVLCEILTCKWTHGSDFSQECFGEACRAVVSAAVRHHIADEKIVPTVLRLLAAVAQAGLNNAVQLLAALDDGVITLLRNALVTAVTETGSIKITRAACSAIAAFTQGCARADVVKQLSEAGADAVLTRVLTDSSDKDTLAFACEALVHIARTLRGDADIDRLQAATRAGLEALGHYPRSTAIASHGCDLLSVFFEETSLADPRHGARDPAAPAHRRRDAASFKLLEEAGGAAVSVLKHHKRDVATCGRACAAVGLFCGSELDYEKIGTMGAVQELAAAAAQHKGDYRITASACLAIRQLAAQAAASSPFRGGLPVRLWFMERLIASGAVATITRAMAADDRQLTVCGVEAIHSLCKCTAGEAASRLLEQGVVKALARAVTTFQFTADCRSVIIRRTCATLYDLALCVDDFDSEGSGLVPRGTPEAVAAILRRESAVQALVDCVVSGEFGADQAVLSSALISICNLVRNASTSERARVITSTVAGTALTVLRDFNHCASMYMPLALAACEVLALASELPQNWGALTAAGAAATLVCTAQHWCITRSATRDLSALVCRALGNLARASALTFAANPATQREPSFCGGSVASALCTLLQKQLERDAGNDAAIIAAITALRDLALLHSLHVHACAAAVMDSKAATAVIEAALPFATHRVAAETLALLRRHESGDSTRSFKGRLSDTDVLWLAIRGSDEDLRRAVPLAVATPSTCLITGVEWAAAAGRADVLDALLLHCGSHVGTARAAALRIVVSRGHVELLFQLVKRWHVDLAGEGNDLLALAAENGHLQAVERLLQENTVASTGSGSPAIWRSAGSGHLQIVERLLVDACTDPTGCFNEAIRSASRGGHLAVLQRLLEDPRVDPGAGGQAPLALAARAGHMDVLHALLADPRVDADAYLSFALETPSTAAAALKPAVWNALLQQPAVLRALLQRPRGTEERLPQLFAAAAAAATSAAGGAARVTLLEAGAWRRRRHAVIGWCTTIED